MPIWNPYAEEFVRYNPENEEEASLLSLSKNEKKRKSCLLQINTSDLFDKPTASLTVQTMNATDRKL